MVDKKRESDLERLNINAVHVQRQKHFSNGWYITYTDNIDFHSSFSYPYPVVTFHGCPGTQREWSIWEKSMDTNFVRWINIIVPGFDGLDERRGNYTGSLADIAKISDMLLESLGFPKVVVLGHSMGSYIGNAYTILYPQRVFGHGLIAPSTLGMDEGMRTFHYSVVE